MRSPGRHRARKTIRGQNAKAASTIDFLSVAFLASEEIERSGDTFSIRRPWARLRAAGVWLRPGWWLLECDMEDGAGTLEVQLSCPSDPLIILSGQNAGTENIYIQDSGPYHIALLISPWPGTKRAKRLRLRRLSQFEALQRIAPSATRVLRNPNRVDILNRIGKRLLAGQALGMRTAVRPPAVLVPKATPAPIHSPALIPERVESWPGVRVILGEGYSVDPRARAIVENAFATSAGLKALYTDVREGGNIVLRKPWDRELAHWCDAAGLPVFFREECWRAGEPAWLQLKAIANGAAGAVGHIPLPLANRPPQPVPVLAPPPLPDRIALPRVSVVLPTKVRLDLLQKCLAGLANATDYPDLEVVIIDNGSDPEVLRNVLDEARSRLNIITVVDKGDFNFSRLINAGAKAATGEVILILNDDVEPIQAGWLHRIIDSLLAPGVGAVGARLIYPDGSVQHAGVALGIGGVCGHLYKGVSREEAEGIAEIVYPGSRIAVTGACLAVRRNVFDAVNGLDEQFPVAFNDIDFCLRLCTDGYRNVYRGDAVLVHHESQSRGADDVSLESRRRLFSETGRFLARWRSVVRNDPFTSPAFDPQIERGVAHRALYVQG